MFCLLNSENFYYFEKLNDIKGELYMDEVSNVCNRIDIALSIYDPKGTYSRHAGVLLASVLNNTRNPVTFHVLHDESLSETNKLKLIKIVADHNNSLNDAEICSIDFIDTSIYFSRLHDIDKICGRFSRGTLYRLASPELMCNLNKVLYFDCDIVVSLDVSELWSFGFKNDDFVIAGVLEDRTLPLPRQFDVSEKPDKLGLVRNRYINAGTLLMNLYVMREESTHRGSLLSRALKYIERYNPPLLDQDFLNSEYLKNGILYLPPKYNTDPVENVYDDVFNLEKVWHFGGHLKPWTAFTGSNVDMLYWKYLALTPWANEIWNSIFSAATNGQYYHRHSNACMKRIQNNIKSNINKALKRK